VNTKKPVTKPLVITLLLLFFLPLRAAAALRLEFGIEPNYTLAFANPVKDYFSDLNDDFTTGRYTFTTPIPDWKDIETPNFHDFGGEGSCLVKLRSGKIRNLRIGPVVGVRISSPTSTYDKTYDLPGRYGTTIPFNFKRQEGINASTISLGARGKASLTDKLDVSSTIGVNFYKVKGDVDYTLDRLDNPYEQYRKADYKGNTTGFMIEAGIDYKIIKKILIGAALDYRTGKVQTKGKQVVTTTTWPEGYSVTGDYSPEFDPSGAYGKFYFGISF
jgi:hypothetical protein